MSVPHIVFEKHVIVTTIISAQSTFITPAHSTHNNLALCWNIKQEKIMYTIIEPHQFELYALLRLKSALKLECAGMKHSKGHSAYGIAKSSFGFQGDKQSVLKQLVAYINNKYNTE